MRLSSSSCTMCPTQAASLDDPAAESHVRLSVSWETSILSTTAHGELKVASSARQLAVYLRVRVKSVVNAASLLLIQDNLQHLAAILFGSQSLADNLDRVHDVCQDSVMHSRQSSRPRPLLCLGGSGSVGSFWLWQDTSRCKEEDVSVRELLLELSCESLLDFVKVLEERNWNEDYDRALAMADFELSSRLDLKWTESRLEVWDVGLQFEKSCRNTRLNLRRMSPRRAVRRDLVESWLRHEGW